jgi:hypothetical protein
MAGKLQPTNRISVLVDIPPGKKARLPLQLPQLKIATKCFAPEPTHQCFESIIATMATMRERRVSDVLSQRSG